jgi:4-hydroxythreonine-4-phosphate dehydrogenase
VIGITIGDPKGIGPEIAAKAFAELSCKKNPKIRLYGPKHLLKSVENGLVPSFAGISDHEAGLIAKEALDNALDDASKGNLRAIVTCPVNKFRMQTVIPGFLGHTEYIANALNAKEPTMVFIGERDGFRPFIISIATRHLPLSKVSKAISASSIALAIERTNEAARRYLCKDSPSIAVLGLNPHAGENGSLGCEEKEFLEPAIKKLHLRGINCHGPFSGDSIISENYDAFVAMYHDQGMIPAKLLCATACVNVTMGLPFIRTSPGHGTAENIAGKGIARIDGLIAATEIAAKLSINA